MNHTFKETLFLMLFLGGLLGVSYYIVNHLFENSIEEKVEKVSVGFEIKLAKLIKSAMRYSKVKDKYVLKSIDEIKLRLSKKAPKIPYELEIMVVRSPVVNAFTFPGGLIVINTGLINTCKTTEECVAVIAHELAHVIHKDSLNSIVRQFGMVALLALVGGNSDILEELVNYLVNANFSRAQEGKADDKAIELLAMAQINPICLANFFKRLKLESPEIPYPYLNTHPSLDSRIEKSESASRVYQGQTKKFFIDWALVKKKAKANN